MLSPCHYCSCCWCNRFGSIWTLLFPPKGSSINDPLRVYSYMTLSQFLIFGRPSHFHCHPTQLCFENHHKSLLFFSPYMKSTTSKMPRGDVIYECPLAQKKEKIHSQSEWDQKSIQVLLVLLWWKRITLLNHMVILCNFPLPFHFNEDFIL